MGWRWVAGAGTNTGTLIPEESRTKQASWSSVCFCSQGVHKGKCISGLNFAKETQRAPSSRCLELLHGLGLVVVLVVTCEVSADGWLFAV